ncbi:MAG: SIMPL domain-containing protein [Bacteroidia bacterium]
MNKTILPPLIISLGIIVGTWILASHYVKSKRTPGAVSVTGLATRDFDSDLIVWSAGFSRRASELQEAFNALKQDQLKIKSYIESKGVPAAEIVFSAVNIDKEYETTQHADGSQSSTFSGYKLSQTVQIESKKIDIIEQLSREVTELINEGIELYSTEPRYYYTKLADLKVDLLAAAAKDARIRAEKIAENAGAGLGKMETGDMGIFQITGQNSNEDYSWGGTFNTSSRKKTASITVRVNFTID